MTLRSFATLVSLVAVYVAGFMLSAAALDWSWPW